MRLVVGLILVFFGLNVFAGNETCINWINKTTSIAGKAQILPSGQVITLENKDRNKQFVEQKNSDDVYSTALISGLNRATVEEVRIERKNRTIINSIFVKFSDGTTETTTMKNNANGECFPKALIREEKQGDGKSIKKLVWDTGLCGELEHHFQDNPNDKKLSESDKKLKPVADIIEKYWARNGFNSDVRNPLKTANDYLNICQREVLGRFGEEKSLQPASPKKSSTGIR